MIRNPVSILILIGDVSSLPTLKNLDYPENPGDQCEEGACKGTRSLVFRTEKVFF